MKLHFGNLPGTMTDAQLRGLVVPFAEPTTLEIPKDSDGSCRGFAFCEFATDEQAQAVITGVDGTEVGGQKIKVAVARPRKGDKPAQTSPAPVA